MGVGQHRQNIYPKRTRQPQVLDEQIGGNDARREVHRKANHHPEEFPKYQISLAQGIGTHTAHQQHQQRTQNSARQADQNRLKKKSESENNVTYALKLKPWGKTKRGLVIFAGVEKE